MSEVGTSSKVAASTPPRAAKLSAASLPSFRENGEPRRARRARKPQLREFLKETCTTRHCLPLCVQEKLDAWDPSKADDVQYLMSMAKKYVILDTLVANGGKCTYEVLFARSEEVCTHTAP